MNDKTTRNVLLLAAAALFNGLVYGSRLIARDLPHYCFSTPLDDAIPVIPWTILIYWGAYFFWMAYYYLNIKCDKGAGYRFIIAHFIGESICLIAFLFLPTIMTRPEITGTTLFDRMLNLTYSVDSPDNLLPSIHCFASWLCWVGARNNPGFSKRSQTAALLMAVAICVSTLTVKQHVLVDAAAGIILAELSYLAAGCLERYQESRRVRHSRQRNNCTDYA